MRPLKRSTLLLVWGRRGLIRRCLIRLSEQTRSKAGAGRRTFAGSAEAVGKRLAIVGEELVDDEGSLIDQALEEAAGEGC